MTPEPTGIAASQPRRTNTFRGSKICVSFEIGPLADLIEQIASVTYKGRTIRHYSFATKYC